MNLLKELKQQTDKQHKYAHNLAFFKALFDNELPIESFYGQIRCIAIIIATMETQLEKQFPDFISYIRILVYGFSNDISGTGQCIFNRAVCLVLKPFRNSDPTGYCGDRIREPERGDPGDRWCKREDRRLF